MRVAILHQAVGAGARPDELDVLVQRDAVSAALGRLGHTFFVLPCALNLDTIRDALSASPPDLVFNLVESLGGTDALQFVVPALIESLGLRMTGSSSEAVFTSGRKTLAKTLLQARSLPTPGWLSATKRSAGHESPMNSPNCESAFQPARYIIKLLAEHASLGMADTDVIDASSSAELLASIRAKSAELDRDCFAEEFIDGREFNISLLAQGRDRDPEVLPPAEIRFEGFAPGKPRIVGSAAKWDENSFEYHGTVRSFEYPPEDAELLDQLRRLSVACWKAFGLAGYARVDFRIDAAGQPWILEANANPCLSPDAGFAAAASRAGISFDEVIARILNDA